jgi:iron complex outermembrane receptor protein
VPLRAARTALALAASLACLAGTAGAQTTSAANTVVITGNPLGREAGVQPASVLAGDGLVLRRASTLGETLDGLPGVSASWFGPNSSRPVIRGLDGDRVRLLNNGGTSIDASNLSFDHAVAMDPLVAERVEVLRGPAALLYGGNATGGVVNTIDNRIPRVPAEGLSGRAELRLGGAAMERSAAAVVEGGTGRRGLAWHADVFGRDSADLRVPRYTPLEAGQALDPATRVRNSAGRASGGALGAGWVGDNGFLGASAETYGSRYGVTAEPDVTIDMQRSRTALAGEWRPPGSAIAKLSFQASHTVYEHKELEGDGSVGTTFRSTGNDLRAELRHAALGGLEGAVGVQLEGMRFSALGTEAFVPGTRTRSQAVVALEEWSAGPLALTAGARLEKVQVDSDGDAAGGGGGGGGGAGRFGGPRQRSFTPLSTSLGASLALAPGLQWSATLGRTERAPAYYELYANGLHVATGAVERGDTSLPTERSLHAETGLAWKNGANQFSASVYRTRFARFIALDATGVDVPQGDGGTVPEYAFRASRALLRGLEVDGRWRVWQGVASVDLTGGLDAVRGDNLDTGQPLPRLAPLRLRAGLEATWNGLRAGLTVKHAQRQARVPDTDTPTQGYTLVDLSTSGPLRALAEGGLWFVKLANAGNALAYNAGTIGTLRGLAPLPGRALSAGVQVRF